MKKTGKIFIYGEIGRNGITPDDVQKVVNSLLENKEVDNYRVIISSPGGSVYDGIAIFNTLKPLKPVVEVRGLAASMASVIAMCGEKVVMVNNARMMIHNPLTMAFGDQNEMKRINENLASLRTTILGAYKDKTGLSQEDLEGMMDKTTYFTAEEAVEKGFCDEIITPDQVENRDIDVFNFMNPIQNKPYGGNKMDKEILALLGLPENATTDEVKAKVETLQASDRSVEQLTAALAQATEKIESLGEKVNGIVSGNADAKAENLVEDAIKALKIQPAMKDEYIKMAKADYDTVKAMIDKMDPIVKSSDDNTNTQQPVAEVDPIVAMTAAIKAKDGVK